MEDVQETRPAAFFGASSFQQELDLSDKNVQLRSTCPSAVSLWFKQNKSFSFQIVTVKKKKKQSKVNKQSRILSGKNTVGVT